MPTSPRFEPLAGRTAYQVLGVPPTASTQEITRAYRRRMRTAHADYGGDPQEALAINKAGSWLRQHRAEYDAYLDAAKAAGSPGTGRSAPWQGAASGGPPQRPPGAGDPTPTRPASLWDDLGRPGMFRAPTPQARRSQPAARPAPARPSQARPSQARPSQARPSQARPSQARPRPAPVPSRATSGRKPRRSKVFTPSRRKRRLHVLVACALLPVALTAWDPVIVTSLLQLTWLAWVLMLGPIWWRCERCGRRLARPFKAPSSCPTCGKGSWTRRRTSSFRA
jgi:DnaJ domain